MNKEITAAVGFLIGGFVGSGITYLYLKKNFEKRVNDEMDAMNRLYKNQIDALCKHASNYGVINNKPNLHLVDIPDVNNNVYHGTDEEIETQLAESEGPQDDEPEEDTDISDEDEALERAGREATLEHSMSKKKRPYIIKAEEFGSEIGYGEATLYYYTEDGAVVTDDDEELDAYEINIGNALTKYGFDKNDEHSIYVRNPNLEMDYEIIKVYQAFNPVSPED